MKSKVLLSLVATLFLAGGALVLYAQDAAKADTKHYKVEFENDKVRVLRVHYGPHEKSVMHAHPDAVAIYLTEGHGKFTMPDGKTMTGDMKPGGVLWTPATTHLPENTGSKPFELIVVELKKK